LLSGVGKSGHIAEKIAATLLSTGTRAAFLDPVHALHGDLGVVAKNDLFIAFSKSGESDELLGLIPFVRARSVRTVAVLSNDAGRLRRLCDAAIVLPVMRELCPFDLAPTTSTEVQLLFGDCLAVALMRKKQISLEQYATNHPGGLIGRKISLKVADLMLRGSSLPLCRPEDRLVDVLHTLSAKRCGCLLAVDGAMALKGIFTDGDLRRSLEAKGSAALSSKIGDLMTKRPRTVCSDALAASALRQMEEDPAKRIMMLPVVEQGRLIGLVQMHDILQAGL
jgi:arabinose-5-phosphate isomerase